ncbi:MAG TPA: hypothetical protein VFR96_03095 [Povalibacter sp.]|jgi:hypothetical protein|nr:hypothetical protein [Povalibacter sp.]
MSSRSGAISLPAFRVARANGWSTAEIRQLRQLAAAGATVGEIAAQLRRSESAIRNKAGMHGIPVRTAHVGTASFREQKASPA